MNALPTISRDEQLAICRLHAASFNMLEILQAFVRNRAVISAEEPFVDPLYRLMNMAEDVLEQAGFTIDGTGNVRPIAEAPADGKLVVIESPFAGDVAANVAYARQCVRDSLRRGENPIASHLLYTQPGILDDHHPDERQRGIEAGLAWRHVAHKAVFYTGRGWSAGMLVAKDLFEREHFPFEVRDMPAVREPGRYAASGGFPSKRSAARDRLPLQGRDF